jgi:hypothetical protein
MKLSTLPNEVELRIWKQGFWVGTFIGTVVVSLVVLFALSIR